MSRHLRLTASLAALGLAGLLTAAANAGETAKKLRVILLDGQNNHKWRETTPVLKKGLEDTGRFNVDVSSNLKPGDAPGSVATIPFPPDLAKYDVVVSNYNGQKWPEKFNAELDGRLKNGQIGLVIVHAANNAFGGWQEYDRMIGMGWRNNKYGKRLKYDDAGKAVLVEPGEDQGAGHRYVGPFAVVVRDPDHPVTRGMPREWLHARDELYDNMRGPIENVHMLATAYSKGTGAHEPMIWTVSYGQGRVFHTPMGHDVNAMHCVGFLATLARGTEWAATGRVTLELPANFPTAEKANTVPN